jgi:hypothetical protein
MDDITGLDEAIEEILADGDDYDPSTDITPAGAPRLSLKAQDVRRLTLFKWKYSLESAGFSSHAAEQLLFLKWMNARNPERVR